MSTLPVIFLLLSILKSKMSKDSSVLVVIPAFNEAETIVELVTRAKRYADVCVVDDASTDETAKLVKKVGGVHLIRHKSNTHIPQAIIDGMKYGLEKKYQYIVTMDAGLSHDPDELERFIAHHSCDLLVSYRLKATNVPWYRKILSKVGTILFNFSFNPFFFRHLPYIKDLTSGYRRYSHRAVQYLLSKDLRARSFDFHTESAAYLVRNLQFSILQIPISYNFSNSSLNMKVVIDSIRMLLITLFLLDD